MKKFPNKTKYTRPHKIKSIVGTKGVNLSRYSVGLRLKTAIYLKYEHLESARRAISRLVKPKEMKNKKNLKHIHSAKKKGKGKPKRSRARRRRFLLIRSNLCNPLTKKPLQTRMGKGKGSVATWVSAGAPSKPILEMSRQHLRISRIIHLLKKSAIKLPVRTKITYSRKALRRELLFKKKI